MRHREGPAEKEERPRKKHRAEAEKHSPANVNSPSDAELHKKGGISNLCNQQYSFYLNRTGGREQIVSFVYIQSIRLVKNHFDL